MAHRRSRTLDNLESQHVNAPDKDMTAIHRGGAVHGRYFDTKAGAHTVLVPISRDGSGYMIGISANESENRAAYRFSGIETIDGEEIAIYQLAYNQFGDQKVSM